MPIQLITAPTVEPVSVVDARAHLNVITSDDDELIAVMITAAREAAEVKVGRSLCTQTWRLTLDSFPGGSMAGVPYGRAFGIPPHAILLERPPVQSVTSIKYDDMAGVEQTVSSTLYKVELSSEPARITPVFGQIWPIPLPQIGAVRVTYVAGYGGADAVPAGIRQWILMQVGTMYANRESISTGLRLNQVSIPDSMLDSLLGPRVVAW